MNEEQAPQKNEDKRTCGDRVGGACYVGLPFLMLLGIMVVFALLPESAGHNKAKIPEDSCASRSIDTCVAWDPESKEGEKHQDCFVSRDLDHDDTYACAEFYFERRAGCGLGDQHFRIDIDQTYFRNLTEVKAACIRHGCGSWTWENPYYSQDCLKADGACQAFFWSRDYFEYNWLHITESDSCETVWMQGRPRYGFVMGAGFIHDMHDHHVCHGHIHEHSGTNMNSPTEAAYICRTDPHCNFFYWEILYDPVLKNTSYYVTTCEGEDTPHTYEEALKHVEPDIWHTSHSGSMVIHAEAGYDYWEYEHAHSFVLNEFFFLLICLFFGAIMKWTQDTILVYLYLDRIPFTNYLLLIGFLLNWATVNFSEYFGETSQIGSMVTTVRGVNPHTLLTIFVPPLIFESSFSSSYHLFKAEFGQALILALPGVLIAAFATGGMAYCIYGIGIMQKWTFAEALLFGSIVSATDPVAVVALLGELGCSERLSTLIEAESLMNDGSAFVMYKIVLEIVQGRREASDVGGIIVLFLQLAGLGALVGLVFGLLCVYWCSVVIEDAAVEITITIVGAYGSFWVAELLQYSGILAVVFFGLTMSKYQTCISPSVEHGLHQVWQYLGWLANVMIFVLSGIVLHQRIFYEDQETTEGWGPWMSELGCTAMFYVVIHISRALAITASFPFLKRLGYGFTRNDGIVLWASGLRGAIGLALGLMTAETTFDTRPVDSPRDERARSAVLFHVCGITILTLLINGVFIRNLLNYLGMTDMTQTAGLIYAETLDHISAETKRQVKKMKNHNHWCNIDWGFVEKNLPNFSKSLLSNNALKRSRKLLDIESTEVNIQMTMFTESDAFKRSKTFLDSAVRERRTAQLRKDVQEEIRTRFLTAFRANYIEQFEKGYIGAKAQRVLVEATEAAMDTDSELIRKKLRKNWQKHHQSERRMSTASDGGDMLSGVEEAVDELTGLSVHYKMLQPYFKIPKWLANLHNGKTAKGLLQLCVSPNQLVEGSISFGVELGTAFMHASEHVEHLFEEFNSLMAHLDNDQNGKTQLSVREEHHKIYQKVVVAVQELELGFEPVVRRVKTKQALMKLIHNQLEFVHKVTEEGLLQEKESGEMKEIIDGTLAKLKADDYSLISTLTCGYLNPVKGVSGGDRKEMLEQVTFLSKLSEGERKRVWKLKEHTYQQIDEILGSTHPLGTLFFAMSGIVSLCDEEYEFIDTVPTGSLLGVYSLLCPDQPPTARYAAKTPVTGIHIPLSVANELREGNLELQDHLARLGAIEVIRTTRNVKVFFKDQLYLTPPEIKEMVMEASVHFAKDDDQLAAGEGLYLLLVKGQAVCYQLDLHLTENAEGFDERDFEKLAFAKAPVVLKTSRRSVRLSEGSIVLVCNAEKYRHNRPRKEGQKHATALPGHGEPSVDLSASSKHSSFMPGQPGGKPAEGLISPRSKENMKEMMSELHPEGDFAKRVKAAAKEQRVGMVVDGTTDNIQGVQPSRLEPSVEIREYKTPERRTDREPEIVYLDQIPTDESWADTIAKYNGPTSLKL